jgi:phospholipid/cholesterol/gamma-HCH transport system substrate-binding protein
MAAKPAIIGGFVLSGLALGVAAILLFGSLRLFSRTQQAVVFFQGSVSGLVVGAPVTFRGVPVGKVKRILLRLDVKDLTVRIPVYIEIDAESVSMDNGHFSAGDAGVERMVKAGLKAQLNTSSFITGQLQVDLDLRPDVEAVHTGIGLDVPEIPAIPSQLAGLKDELSGLHLQQLGDSAQRTLVSIERVSDQLGDKIGPLIANVQNTSDTARVMLQTTTEAVRQIQVDTARTLSDIDRLAVEGRQQLTARGSELSRVLVGIDHAAHQADTLMVSLNDMTSPRSQMRGDLEAAIRDLAATASSLRNFSREVERNPSLILTGKSER